MGTHSVVPESNDDASPFRFLFLLVTDYKNVTVGSRATSVGTPGSSFIYRSTFTSECSDDTSLASWASN